MKNAIDLLKELKEKSGDWKDLIIRFIDGNLDDTDDLYKAVFSVFRAIRESYRTTEQISEDIITELDDPELVSLISDYIKKSLGWFFDLSLLRQLENENDNLAEKLISIVMEEFIIHNGVNGETKIKELLDPVSEYDEKSLLSLIHALGAFTKYSITNNSNKECIRTNILEDGGLPEKLCEQIADLIWENRIELKIDYIIHQIGDVGSALKSL